MGRAAGLAAVGLIVAMAALAGCAATSEPAQQQPARSPTEALRSPPSAQAGGAVIGPLPNSGLTLPVVSPDGRWVAALAVAPGAVAHMNDLWTGGKLPGVSLVVRPTQPGQTNRVVLSRGAAWPVWAANSARLVAVSYAVSHQGHLLFYDPHSAQSHSIEVGLPAMRSLAPCPDGVHLAVVAAPTNPVLNRVFIVNVNDRSVTPLPAPAAAAQYLPQWCGPNELVYIQVAAGHVALMRWSRRAAAPHRVSTLDIQPATWLNILHAHVGIAAPISPGGRWWAFYDAARDRIVLINLADGRHVALVSGTRAGCWMGDDRFIAATDKALLVFDAATGDAVTTIVQGRTLPLWAAPDGHTILYVIPTEVAWQFQLLRHTTGR